MLMVIFGAGASYDSIPSRPPGSYSRKNNDEPNLRFRPPLANELFDDVLTEIGEIQRFSQCQPILPYLQRHGTQPIEAVLENLREEAASDSRGFQQLTAIRYYLQYMLRRCEREWKATVGKGISNYKTLLDQIEKRNKTRQKVCLVTFNYDTLIEDALPSVGVTVKKIEDYISDGTYSLIKLHGSVNWGREVQIPVLSPEANAWSIVSQLVDAAPHLKLSENFCIVDEQPISNQAGTILFPALAIPVQTKKSFECPTPHLERLCEVIPRVTKLLIIGWRGAEAHFLEILRQSLVKEVRVMVVAGSTQDGNEVVGRLKTVGLEAVFSTSDSGFTDFILRREANSFLCG